MRQKILFQLVLFLIIVSINSIKSEFLTDYLSPNSFNDLNKSYFKNETVIAELLEVSWFTTTIFTLLFGALSVLAISGNSLILWCVIKNPKMHNVTNYFICNLAMADIVIGLFAIPFQFQAALLQYWALPKFLCKVAPFSQELSVNVSIFTLVAISLDRYYVILYPFKEKLRPKQCFIILFFIWITSLSISSVNLYNYNIEMVIVIKSNESIELARCSVKNGVLYKYHKISVVLIQYIIPFIILCFTYFRIGYYIRYVNTIETTNNQKQEKNRRKVVKMIFIVISLFMLCWFPLQLYHTLAFINESINSYEYILVLFLISYFFAMSNSCYNVFIYGLCSARFKNEFRKFFSCLPCIDKSKIDETGGGYVSRNTKITGKNETRETLLDKKFSGESSKVFKANDNKKVVLIALKGLKVTKSKSKDSIKTSENTHVKNISIDDNLLFDENVMKSKIKPNISIFAKFKKYNKKTDIDRQIQKLC